MRKYIGKGDTLFNNSKYDFMVGVAQLVELRIVIPVVAGSSPVAHPIFKTATKFSQMRAVSSVGRAGDS